MTMYLVFTSFINVYLGKNLALMMLKRGFEDLKHYAETIHDKFEEAERAFGIQS